MPRGPRGEKRPADVIGNWRGGRLYSFEDAIGLIDSLRIRSGEPVTDNCADLPNRYLLRAIVKGVKSERG
jgi:hypothetical protein